MSNFSEYRRINSTWYSPAFHIAGYQLQLVVEPGGLESGKGNYVSVYVRLMKGKHDYMLEWPFKAEMIIDLINWGEDKGHVTKTLRFDGNTPIRYRQRVTQDHAAPYIWGYDKFIQHADLDDKPNNKKRFLQDDTLCFRVLKITLLTGSNHNYNYNCICDCGCKN